MTIREKLEKMLFEHGLFENQAKAVIDLLAADSREKEDGTKVPANGALVEVLDKQVEGYPPQMIAVAFMTAKNYAVKWIDANCPQHWARPMFADAADLTHHSKAK